MDTRGEFACIPYLGDDLPGVHLVALSLSDGGVVLVYRDEVMWVFYNQNEACLCRPFCENNGTLTLNSLEIIPWIGGKNAFRVLAVATSKTL